MPRRTAQESEATRTRLVAVARRLFAERGYEAVGTEEIVAAAGVTRGALYHHFRDKRDLFRAAFVAVERDFVAGVAERAFQEDDPFERLRVGCVATLERAAGDPEVRIALIEAPAVLGFAEWRELVDDTSLGAVRLLVSDAMRAGAIREAPIEPLSQVLLGALNEGTRVVAAGEPVDAVAPALLALLEGLRPPGEVTAR